jgi:hypothetical protein
MGSELSCVDCCISAIPDGKIDRQAAVHWTRNVRFSIDTALSIELTILILWLAMSFVNGFSLYTIDPSILVPTGGPNVVSHIGWWAIISFTAAWFGASVTKFVPWENPSYAVEMARRYVIFYMILLVISTLSDSVHLGLTGLEIGIRESVLAVQNWGFLIALIVVQSVYLFLKLYILVRCWQYVRLLTPGTGMSPLMDAGKPAGSNSVPRAQVSQAQVPQPVAMVTNVSSRMQNAAGFKPRNN